MTEKELSRLTDEELLKEAKKMKSATIINAALIGFMIGIVIYSVVKMNVGIFTLIPLYFIYKAINNPDHNKALEKILKERNLN
jgi:hypothetical protein